MFPSLPFQRPAAETVGRRIGGYDATMRTQSITSLYDKPGPFATVLVDISQDAEDGVHQRELRVAGALEQLSEKGAPDDVVRALAERLDQPTQAEAPVVHAVVANESEVLLDEVLPHRLDDAVTSWQPLPDLSMWIRLRDAGVVFAVVQADREGSDVEVYRTAGSQPNQTAQFHGDDFHITQVAAGGWSQSRYQRHAREMWHRNAKQTVDEIETLVAEGFPVIVLAGDKRAREEIRSQLSKHADEAVAEVESGGRAAGTSDESFARDVTAVLRERVVSKRLDYVHELQQRSGQGSGVARGYDDVLDAMVQGQVETLLLDPVSAHEHEVRPGDHRGLDLGLDTGATVAADLALVAAAARTAADVVVLPKTVMGGEPATALLRWDSSASSSAQTA